MTMQISLTPETYKRVMYWVEKAGSDEISGLGLVQLQPNETFKVVDAMLLPQKNGSGHTDIEGDAVAKAMYTLRDSEGMLKWWWHSHVNMSVFWSGTDDATIKTFGGADWIVASVFNKKREMKSAFYHPHGTVTPFGTTPLFLNDITTTIHEEPHPNVAAWDIAFEENVTKLRQTPGIYVDRTGHWDGDNYIWPSAYTQSEAFPKKEVSISNTPQLSRPRGISKREWKQLRRGKQILPTSHYPNTAYLDTFGFTPDEQHKLTGHGIEDEDIETFIAAGLTPQFIYRAVVEMSIPPWRLASLVSEGCSMPDILYYFNTVGAQIIYDAKNKDELENAAMASIWGAGGQND